MQSVPRPYDDALRGVYNKLIHAPDGVKLMNRKGEWGQNLPPKFTYDQPQDEQKKKKFNLAKNRPKKRKSNNVTEIPEISKSAPLCDVTCDVSHPQHDSHDSRDSHDSQDDSQQQSQGHGQDIQTWPSNSQTYTTTDGIPKEGSNEKLSLAWAEDSTMNERLDPGDINFFKNKHSLASLKGVNEEEGRQIARR